MPAARVPGLIDHEGVVRREGFPLLEGHELTADFVRGILDGKKDDAPSPDHGGNSPESTRGSSPLPAGSTGSRLLP